MKKYELSLTRNYVSSWGMVEAVRELIQNAIDSESPFIYQFIIGCEADESENGSRSLALWSEFTTLPPSTLLLGATSKADSPDAIGSFGEGYKIAMLVLTRLGYPMEILNGAVRWVPGFEFNKNYGDELLCVYEEPCRDKTNRGVTFIVHGLTDADVAAVQASCLRMQNDIGAIKRTAKGDILLERPGKLYVGSLYICDTEMKYGYNIKPEFVKLERDRQTVSYWKIRETTAEMWFETEEYDHIAKLVEAGTPDLEDVQFGSPELVKEACYRLFRQKHPGAIVARNSDELNKFVASGMETVILVGSYHGAVTQFSGYKEDLKGSMRAVEQPLSILTRWLADNRKAMHTPAIVSFKALIEESKGWKK